MMERDWYLNGNYFNFQEHGMKIGIMQPYFFPYIGYFQLIAAVDRFVIYDDVNYIKGGWINRNNILSNGKKQLITLQALGASSNKLINEVQVGSNHRKLLKTIKQAYSKAPYFDTVYPLLESCFACEERCIARFLSYSITKVCAYLEISTEILISSTIHYIKRLRGSEKIIALCQRLGGDTYINSIGGKVLYDKQSFKKEGLDLFFLKTGEIKYSQVANEFVPFLSIIDVMMFNSIEEIQLLLRGHELE